MNHNVITVSEKVQCFLPREASPEASSSLEKRLTVKKEYVQPVTWLERADGENCDDVLLVTTPFNEEWIRNVSWFEIDSDLPVRYISCSYMYV